MRFGNSGESAGHGAVALRIVVVTALLVWPACESAAKPCQPDDLDECQSACSKGSMPSCTSLGILHKNSKAYGKARPLFEKACKAKDMRGCDELAADYMLGHSVAVDSEKAMELAYALTRRGGTTVSSGLSDPKSNFSIQHVNLVAEERTIKGSYLGSCVPKRDIPDYIELFESGHLPVYI